MIVSYKLDKGDILPELQETKLVLKWLVGDPVLLLSDDELDR